MDALGRPAASSIFATDVFIIPEPKTGITRPPSVHIGRRTGSTTNLDLIDLLFFPFSLLTDFRPILIVVSFLSI